MRIVPISLLCAVLLAALTLSAFAQESGNATEAMDVAEITARLQEQYETMTSFKAAFTQILHNTASGESEERSGVLYYKKPQLIRWETVSPENELLVVGQDAVWDYFADEEVAYRYDLDAVLESKTMLRFISGQANLEEEFYVEIEGREDGMIQLALLPLEPEPQLVEAHLWVDPATGMFTRIKLMDFYANENELIFSDMERNPDLAQDLFAFTPPENVEVMDNTESTMP